MSSTSERITLEIVERFLREHGLDESRASAVQEVLSAANATMASGDGSITDRDERRPSGVPTVASVAATILAVSLPPRDSVTAVTTLREAEPRRLVPGVLLGAGGMGEVVRVRDHALHRQLAMKILLPDLDGQRAMRDRFIEEAQVTAQLAHPGIPPVHEIGDLDDGRPYFTMKEVRGVTLAQVVDEVQRDPGGAIKWSEQRRLEIFQKVCEAVAYAHARGVAHCDLKPHNVMVGAFGEVLVMDWGVARLVSPSASDLGEAPVVTSGLAALETLVAGTPAYMAPEQARGEIDRLGPPADVYALGVMLFELLAGERPYKGTPRDMVDKARAGVIPPLPRKPGSTADDALYAIICRAMNPDPQHRYGDAKSLAGDLARWREGAMRREKALAILSEVRTLLPRVEPMFARAAELRDRAGRELAQLGPDASVADKEPLWAMQDEAALLARDALLQNVEAEQLLLNALAHAPDFDEAKALIAEMRFHRHRDAEKRRAWDEAARHEVVLRKHDTGAYRDYLEGRAPLSIATDPPCRVRLHRFVTRARQLAPELVQDLGETPLLSVELPVGSYLLELLAPERPPIGYPIILRRRGGWCGARPGEDFPFPIPLPLASDLTPGDIFVAAGCAEIGGDEAAPGSLREDRVWVDGFVIREHPVTSAELATFLADPAGAPFRRAVLRDGLSVWRHDWPAVGASFEAACAYAAWFTQKTGLPWRLPSELEWEKAARGVDGRFYPWGDFTDASFCHARTIEKSPRAPTSIHDYPTDRSPYGVRGLGGNVREWCEGRVVRGGSWRQSPEAARAAARTSLAGSQGYPDVGFRLVRSL